MTSQSATDRDPDFKYGNQWVDGRSPGNGRYNMAESELAQLPREGADEWRRLWATVQFPSRSIEECSRYYFRRVVDREDFRRTFEASGAIVRVGGEA